MVQTVVTRQLVFPLGGLATKLHTKRGGEEYKAEEKN
jgi:hypothetical protein